MNPSDSDQTEAELAESVSSILGLPLDIVLVGGFVLFFELFSFLGPYVGTLGVLQALLALPFVFFLPGYALLSVLFPRDRHPAEDRTRWMFGGSGGLRWGERVVLSFGTSLVLLPPLGLLLGVSGLGYAPVTVVNSLTVVILAGLVLGGVRRAGIPRTERYQIPVGSWREELADARVATTPLEGLLNLVIVVVLAAAIVTLALAFVAPPAAESYSGFTLLAENGQGELVASGYPETLVAGENYEYAVGIENFEGATTSYAVVAELQRVRSVDGNLVVVQRERVAAFQTTLGADERVVERTTVRPELVGEELRLVYYLYTDEPPAQPNDRSAYRSVFVWVTVAETAAGAGGDAAGAAGNTTRAEGVTPTPVPTPASSTSTPV